MTNTDLENALKVMIGSQEAEAMYIGSSLLWSNTPVVPYDSKVEYLYVNSNKGCYIDTGIIPDANTGVYAKLYTSHNNDEYIIGLRNDTTDTRWLIGHSGTGWYCGHGEAIFIEDNRLPYINAIYEIELNFKNSGKMSNLTNDTYKNLSTLSFTPANSITIFKANCFDGALTNQTFMSASCRIYGVKISQGNDIIMDLIPVRVGLTGYMYDNISKRLFGNLGTGSFILGPDIVEIEYLESTGILYINTDYKVWNYGLSGEIKMLRIGDHTGYDGYIGRTNTGGLELYYRSGMGIALWLDRGANSFDIPTNSLYYDTNIHVVLFEITSTTSYVSVDGDTYSVTDSLGTGAKEPILLFSHRGYYNAEGRIYYCKLYDNNILVLDLIPVRIGQVGYMYDKVSNQLFGNAGSGDFVLGPDKT